MKKGEEIEIVSGTSQIDQQTLKDIQRILPRDSYERDESKIRKDNELFIVIRLKKTSINHKKGRFIMSAIELSTLEAASTVDSRGSACPGPLLEAKKGIGKVKVGEVLEIYSNDSGTRTDIPAWSKKVGHEYVGMIEADGYDKHFVCRKK